MKPTTPVLLSALMALSITACGSAETSTQGGGGTTTTTAGGGGTGAEAGTGTGATSSGGTTTATTGGTGATTTTTEPQGPPDYAPGPYGYDIGSTIADYEFIGFPFEPVAPDTAQVVRLSDFYNPTGQGTYPDGSPYGAFNPMPKLLLVHVAAVWAGPCNYEADQIIPPALAAYAPCLQVMEVLQDGPTPGKPAAISSAYNWATKYDATYPVVVDPAYQLAPIFVFDAYPTNILIDTQTMEILDVIVGAPELPTLSDMVSPTCP